MRLVRTALLTVVLCILFAFDALAITEYPWTGSEKDASRAGGLGWVTVTEELVLPGTKECSVTIFQSGDERWGYMAGEEDPEEFHWTIKLYEEDNYSAKVQLPYSTYTTYYLGVNTIPEEYRKNIPEGDSIYWFPANNLMIEESPHDYPEIIETSCRLSAEDPAGIISNDLIMLYSNAEATIYEKDISFIFQKSGVPEKIPKTTSALKPEKETGPTEPSHKIPTSSFNATVSKVVLDKKTIWPILAVSVLTTLAVCITILKKRRK